tara:strand:+ start:475 stop:1029 length:555 start_codon:yes stop_codon:yes gene_type:complete
LRTGPLRAGIALDYGIYLPIEQVRQHHQSKFLAGNLSNLIKQLLEKNEVGGQPLRIRIGARVLHRLEKCQSVCGPETGRDYSSITHLSKVSGILLQGRIDSMLCFSHGRFENNLHTIMEVEVVAGRGDLEQDENAAPTFSPLDTEEILHTSAKSPSSITRDFCGNKLLWSSRVDFSSFSSRLNP